MLNIGILYFAVMLLGTEYNLGVF